MKPTDLTVMRTFDEPVLVIEVIKSIEAPVAFINTFVPALNALLMTEALILPFPVTLMVKVPPELVEVQLVPEVPVLVEVEVI